MSDVPFTDGLAKGGVLIGAISWSKLDNGCLDDETMSTLPETNMAPENGWLEY